MTLFKATDLLKAKYLRRWRGSNGDWKYTYYNPKGRNAAQEKPTGAYRGTLKGVATEKEIKELTKHFARRPKGMGKEKTIQTRRDLDIILKYTTFAMMSAGRNPNNEEDMKLTDAQIKARHSELISRLKEEGFIYTQCRGKYVNPEESVMVMMHDADRETAMAIGESFHQDSIVFTSKGKNELIYTTGEKKGKTDMAGSGFEEVPKATDFYTKMPLSTGDTVKFSLMLDDVNKAMRMLIMQLEKSIHTLFIKSKKMPVGTVSKGRKKVAEGDWRPVKKGTSSKKGVVKKPVANPSTPSHQKIKKIPDRKYVIWGVAPGKDYEDLLVSEKVDVNDSNMESMKKKLESLGVTKIRFSELEPLTDSTKVADMFRGAVVS